MNDFKICNKCKSELHIEDFNFQNKKLDLRKSICRGCCRISKRKWDLKNQEKISSYNKKRYTDDPEYFRNRSRTWRMENPEKYKETYLGFYKRNREDIIKKTLEYKEKNPEKIKKYNKTYQVKMLEEKGNSYISCLIRGRLNQALRRQNAKKPFSSTRSLGCDIESLRKHLEEKFYPHSKTGEKMSWGNRGKWHIDHVLPLSKFDLADPEQYKKACHYTNLQPLWACDNLKKHNKVGV